MNRDYTPPVSRLLTLRDLHALEEWPDHPGEFGFGPEHVDGLIEMATDEELNWSGPDDPGVWAPIHAWRTLGELRAAAAIEPLTRLFHELEDNDWAADELPEVYGMIGREAVPTLSRYLGDERHGLYPRVTAAGGLAQIGQKVPAARAECVEALGRALVWFRVNDPTLNALLISCLIDLEAVEVVPLMERAFADDAVDTMVVGDWEDAQVDLGLLTARKPRVPACSPARSACPVGIPASPNLSSRRAMRTKPWRRQRPSASRRKHHERRTGSARRSDPIPPDADKYG